MSTILIVEDEQMLREILAENLTNHGYAVLTAADGLAAKKILVTTKIDLIVSDVRMPNMDGVDLLKFTQSLPDSPKVVLISGFADFTRDELIDMGAAGFLHKPFDMAQLLTTVKSLVSLPTVASSTEQT